MDNTATPTQQEVSAPKMHPFWKHFSKRTLALIVVLLFITGGLVYLAVREEQPSQIATVAPTPTPNPAHAVLSFVPETSSTSAIQTVDVVVESNQNHLTGAQLNIAFDPKVLSNVTIKPGTYFTNPTVLFTTVDKVNGQISYVLGIGANGQEASGSGTVATISYTLLPTASPSTKLSFLPKTEVTQQGVLGSVLKRSTGLTIQIPVALQLSPTASPAAQ